MIKAVEKFIFSKDSEFLIKNVKSIIDEAELKES